MASPNRSIAPHRLPFSKAILVFVLVIGLITSHPQSAHASQTWNVTPSSACTLSDAIIANNTSASSGSCVAGSGGIGIINMAAGTYTLNADLPSPANSLSVVGASVGSTIINGQNAHSVFTANGGTLLNVSNLTIEGAGNNEPAIISDGGTINNVVVENSTAAGFGIILGGGGSVTNTAITNVTINDSNSLDGIGLMLGGGTFIVNNVTSYGNGVGIVVGNQSQSSTVTMVNDTIANNSNTAGSPGGIVAFNATINLENSILNNNTSSGTAANCGTGPFPLTGDSMVLPTSQGHNISSDGTCGLTGTSNLSSTSPQLGSLTQASGTYVLPITYNSPAYASAYTPAAPSTDQRGVSRPQCGTADIGAYETTTCAPVSSSGAVSGSGSSSSGTGTSSKKSSSTPSSTPASTSAAPSATAGTTSSTPVPTSILNQSNKTSSSKSSSKKTSSHTAVWAGAFFLLVAIGGGWFYFSRNPKLLAKLLGNITPHKAH